MNVPTPVITIPRCTRCAAKLSYEGRPCHLCIAPAGFRIAKGFARDIKGPQRQRDIKLPKFAQPIAVRGKKAVMPRGERMIATLRLVGRWTWNSIGIAAGVHLLAVILALFLRAEIESVIARVSKVAIEDKVAVAATPAPEPEELEAPFLNPEDDELIMPDKLDDTVIDTGSPEYEAPPDERIYAPEPQVAPPRPAPPNAFPARLPKQPNGLGGGQPEPVKRPPTGSGLFVNRNGDSRAGAIKRYGGGDDTEEAVNLGLEYLARQQGSDGSWDPNKGFEVPPDWGSRNNGYRGAITALCTLPFLAAGNSPDEGRYKSNVRRALNWLMNRQKSDGYISYAISGDMYTHCVATLALCEAYGMTRDEEIGKSAERAVRYLERTQGNRGGWDYQGYITASTPTGGTERNDGSISGWAILAFKSAKSVGIKVNERTWTQMAELYDRLSLNSGETYYADAPYGRLSGTRKGVGMVGVGLTSRVILDDDRFEARNAAAEELLLHKLPTWDAFHEPTYDSTAPNFNTFYGLYYCTLGMFLKNGGEGYAWSQWNEAMKKTLLPQQVKRGSRKGSWEPVDTWIGPIMGDLYSTACSVLCLEVYYRYNPMHRADSAVAPVASDSPAPDKPAPRVNPEPREDTDSPADRSRALRALVNAKGSGAVADLIKALSDEASSVRSTALSELGKLKAKDAAPAVSNMLAQPGNDSLRFTIVDTLGRLGDRSVYPALVKLLGDSDESIQQAARNAMGKLSGGKDFGVNKNAWRDWFERNP